MEDIASESGLRLWLGVSEEEIERMGRFRSRAFKKYIRIPMLKFIVMFCCKCCLQLYNTKPVHNASYSSLSKIFQA